MTTAGAPAPSKETLLEPWRVAVVFALALFLVVLVRTAWVSDDAYLTFRTVDNFNHGLGLRWNAIERVQAYTHPLWMLCLAAVTRFSGEFYLTSLGLAVALSLITAWLVVRLAVTPSAALMGVSVLVLSHAFVDYSTSGLENPLTHALLASFFVVALGRDGTRWQYGGAGLLAGLLAVNRLDTILLVAPILLVMIWTAPGGRARLAAAIGLALPIAAWECFSLVYYGFLFPNTAYAKLKTGIEAGALARQGMVYLVDSVGRDPLTLMVVVAALGVGWWSRSWRERAISIGILLYLGYIVRIGGDFMSGRFLSGPLLCAVIVLVRIDTSEASRLFAFGTTLVLGLMPPNQTIASGAEAGGQFLSTGSGPTGIVDERRFYYPFTGLLRMRRDAIGPTGFWADDGRQAALNRERVIVRGAVGVIGFYAGPSVYVVDETGLGDPLLARLPPVVRDWRIGHFFRRVPDGYVESLESGQNRLKDANLATYYDLLTRITRDPIWSRRRWRAIWKMNRGEAEGLLASPSAVAAGRSDAS